MKPLTLAVVIAIWAFAGVLLSLATSHSLQYTVATVTAVGLAFTLGACWPVHRNFTVAGLAIGLAFGAAMFGYLVFLAITEERAWYYDNYRYRLLIVGVFYAFAIFGGWTFVVGLGAGATWLARQLRRPRAVEGLV